MHPDTLKEKRRVVAASAIGTTIEWYDFFIYSTSAALVFSSQFFSALDPATALLASMATLGVTFLVRPFGSAITGHYGDRIGRKKMLILTLGVMGAATVAVGLLPTYAQIGIWAPILLVLMRCLQGFSAGGEWAGAALMAVEHAPPEQRGLYGSSSQIGTPIGLILANGIFLLMVSTTTEAQFLSWGWRIPFLLSYDGRCGTRSYGEPLPAGLRLTHLELEAGRSSQATLAGRAEHTVESLYMSPALAHRE